MNQPTANLWLDYYNAQAGRVPRPLLLDALSLVAPSHAALPRTAIDLGCGEGTETLALLQHGWRVLAIDQEPEAIRAVERKVPAAYRAQLQTQVAAFENVSLPVADLIYAGYSLPFCSPVHFAGLWAKIVAALRVEGRFAGQLFGEHDSWATRASMTFHTAAQARQCFSEFTIEAWQEEDKDGDSFVGPKHWHIFHVIARKIG